VHAASSKKPDNAKFMELLTPTSTLLNELKVFKDKNRTSKQFNHLSGVSEGASALAWVCVSLLALPPLLLFVDESI
jgi:adenylyl cyclase-associated protein